MDTKTILPFPTDPIATSFFRPLSYGYNIAYHECFLQYTMFHFFRFYRYCSPIAFLHAKNFLTTVEAIFCFQPENPLSPPWYYHETSCDMDRRKSCIYSFPLSYVFPNFLINFPLVLNYDLEKEFRDIISVRILSCSPLTSTIKKIFMAWKNARNYFVIFLLF